MANVTKPLAHAAVFQDTEVLAVKANAVKADGGEIAETDAAVAREIVMPSLALVNANLATLEETAKEHAASDIGV